jgi:hypothetical protein
MSPSTVRDIIGLAIATIGALVVLFFTLVLVGRLVVSQIYDLPLGLLFAASAPVFGAAGA